MKKFEGQCLGYETMEGRGQIFANAFDFELGKFGETDAQRILTWASTFYMQSKLHVMFTQESIETLRDDVFTEASIRDFVMSLTDRFCIGAGLGEVDDYQIERTIALGLAQDDRVEFLTEPFIRHSDKFQDQIPKEVSGNFQRNATCLFALLSTNPWLVTLVFINLHFMKTKTYVANDTSKPSRSTRTAPASAEAASN